MIRNYNLGTAFASLAKPTGIGKGYFHNNDAGFTLDYLYGPYDVPENEGILQFTYEDADENTVTRPTLLIDGDPGPEGTWSYNQSNEPVYNTRLDYQKALAEQMLTDMNQFFVGKKVAFITDEGKAKEYVVVPIPNTDPVELEFEDADLVDIYTVKFMTINGSGAQADVETVTKFYTLPQSLFIPPKEELNGKTVDQLFKGWYFGYMNGDQQLVIDESTLYRVGQSANLQTLCEQGNITDRTVTFYAKYMEHDDVLVDFENGYYKANGDFVSLDGGADMDGYMLVQNGSAANNTKPEDWDIAYSSYFTRARVEYGQYVRTTYNWVRNNGYLDTALEWNEDNFNTYFPTGHYNDNPKEAICPYYGTSTAPYYVVVVENEFYFWSDEPAWWFRKYYKFQSNPTNTWKYVPCTSNYETYKASDLYTHAVKDTIALFDNGLLIGNVVYDCMDDTTPQAYQGLLAQLNTYIPYSYYSDRFEFDRWEIIPKKITDEGNWETDQTMASWTDSHVNATVALDSTYETEVNGDTVTYPADAYVFKAVYRKRDEYYSRLQLATNCEASGTPSGEIQITCKYKKPRRPNLFGTCTVGTYNASSGYHLDQALANSQSIQLGNNGFEFDPNVIVSFTLTAVANTTTPVTIPYCWTGNYIGQSLDTTLADIPVEGGITKSYKAWFVYEGDINATVKVKKRLSTAHTNVVTCFGGSRVGIFDWKLRDNQIGTIINGHTVDNMEYMYDHSHLVPGSSVPITNQDLTHSGTLEGPFPSTTGNQGRWQKVIDEQSPLVNPASIALDETGHGYCFIKAIEAQNGASFIQWSDGDTNPVKLVDVTLPTLYSYTAIFQGTPLSMVEVDDYADMANRDYTALVAAQCNPNTNNNTDINVLSHIVENGTFALSLPDGEQFVYVHVPGVGLTDNPEVITEYNNVATVMRNTIASAPNQDGTVTYDYKGTQYKETLVETGKDITLAY